MKLRGPLSANAVPVGVGLRVACSVPAGVDVVADASGVDVGSTVGLTVLGSVPGVGAETVDCSLCSAGVEAKGAGAGSVAVPPIGILQANETDTSKQVVSSSHFRFVGLASFITPPFSQSIISRGRLIPCKLQQCERQILPSYVVSTRRLKDNVSYLSLSAR